ncbi:HigA family addiction module antitoxin [Aurantiacibacter sediminis]|uniref:HigA family addiction module antidote protein n=1 Tax=Aurantiacibacter sediminis TaxID=2793064 RepID=A0ABS0N572_9SPHN|nr:HigA family addiction module antitoxin [Aurantiacibacter sediminis]MBH5322943.1 HigA family addiction module antidote protein [Aurantiacibacter sediminis]
MVIKLHDSFAVHPGPWLRRNFVSAYRLSVSATAEHLKVSRVGLSNLLNGKAALSPEMAIRFEKAFGVDAGTLLRMQSAHDLVVAKKAAKSLKVDRLAEPA